MGEKYLFLNLKFLCSLLLLFLFRIIFLEEQLCVSLLLFLKSPVCIISDCPQVKRRRRVNGEVSKIFHHIKTHKEHPGRQLFCLPSGLATFTCFALRSAFIS